MTEVSQFGPTYDVEAVEAKLAQVDRTSGLDVDVCEQLRCDYRLLQGGIEHDGLRGDIVKRLMAYGLPLRNIALYLDTHVRDVVRCIAPPALQHLTDAVLCVDELVRDGQDWRRAAMSVHLPLGFVEQLRQWQTSSALLDAYALAAKLILVDNLPASVTVRRVADATGVELPYDNVFAMSRPARRASTARRYGLD